MLTCFLTLFDVNRNRAGSLSTMQQNVSISVMEMTSSSSSSNVENNLIHNLTWIRVDGGGGGVATNNNKDIQLQVTGFRLRGTYQLSVFIHGLSLPHSLYIDVLSNHVSSSRKMRLDALIRLRIE